MEIQSKIAIKSISKGNDKKHVMHSKSYNIEFMIYDNPYEVTEELFESIYNRYQVGLERSMRGSDFILDYVHLCYYKCHKINYKRRRPYINSPDCIKNKKATIKSINKKDNQCFQQAVTVMSDHEEIKKRLTNNNSN